MPHKFDKLGRLRMRDKCERLQKELTRKATKLNDVVFDNERLRRIEAESQEDWKNLRADHQTALDRVQKAEAERDEYTELFNLRRDADRRAIVRWQEATGRKAILPDHADLCVWLMDEVQRVYAITVAEREKAAVVQSIADEMIQRVAELERERDEARAVVEKVSAIAASCRKAASNGRRTGQETVEGRAVAKKVYEEIGVRLTAALTIADRQPTDAEIQYGLKLQPDAEKAMNETEARMTHGLY